MYKLYRWDVEMVTKRWEITIVEPLNEFEAAMLIEAGWQKKWDIVATNNGRIIVIEGPKSIKPIIKFVAKYGFAEDVGLIKEISDYEPVISEMNIEAIEER